jgi:hypothetical protein
MSEFTKGEWTADEFGAYVFAHDNQMMICKMRGDGYLMLNGLSDKEIIEVQKANARLIAAAPEMYELLKVLVQREYDNTVTALLALEAEKLLARIDGEDADHD